MKNSFLKRTFIIFLSISLILFANSTIRGNEDLRMDLDNKKIVNIGVEREPITLNPILSDRKSSYICCTSIYDTLIIMEDINDEPRPGLAESWELSPDKRKLKLKIRKGVKFHNGDDLSLRDIVFSFNLAINNPKNKSICTSMYYMDVTGKDEVTLFLRYPFESITKVLSSPKLSILNEKLYLENPEKYNRFPIGTGPFKMKSWDEGNMLSLSTNEEYYRGRAAIDGINIVIEPDTDESLEMLKNGKLQVLTNPCKKLKNKYIDDQRLDYYEKPSSKIITLAMNNSKGLFSEKILRQAVSHAIDKKELCKNLYNGQSTVMDVPVSMNIKNYSELFEAYRPDKEIAKKILSQSKYINERVSIKTTADDQKPELATMIMLQLEEVGIQAKVEVLSKREFNKQVKVDKNYDLAIVDLISDYPDPESPLYTSFHSKMRDGIHNIFGADYPELDKFLEEARSTTGEVKRGKAYKKVYDLIKENAIVLPLYSYMSSVVCSSEYRGLTANSLGRIYMYNIYQ